MFTYMVQELIQLRKKIHQNPELSGFEKNTAQQIKIYLEKFSPDNIITGLGGEGLAAIFKGDAEGPTVAVRCELDALPIEEINTFEYKSSNKSISHKCGHDGHMTITAGLAPLLSSQKLHKGKVVLLFQPAEETGEGAEKILHDSKFNEIKPDYILALHNLPGFPMHQIILKDDTFAAASKGIIIKLTGKTSHAAEPENGINPAGAMQSIIHSLLNLTERIKELKDFSLITVVHAKLGERAFGTSPGYAEVMATLRAFCNDDMDLLTQNVINFSKKAAEAENLSIDFEFTEEFPATVNDYKLNKIVEESAKENNLDIVRIKNSFRWSEDFGHFTKQFPGVLFGLGSGKDQPDLHNPDYDFPDELIETGRKIFYSIIKKILK